MQQDPGWTIIRSLKRYLENAGPETRVEIGGGSARMLDLLTELAASLRKSLLEQSSLNVTGDERLEAMLGVPANANGNQRFLTVEAFRRAGFEVLGLLNEPSAASIEFTHANKGRFVRNLRFLLVYDLGGGTFDASLVEMDERTHSIKASEGIPTLGGDDFDTLLAEMALDASGIPERERDGLRQAEWFRLHEECRQKKEAVHPNTRRIVVDLALVRPEWSAVTVPVEEFYSRCGPMVDETLHAVQDLLGTHGVDPDALYVTGGGSELPLVPRMLRDVFGKRVRRSSYTHSATAIGLAIQADEQAGYVLRETFTRFFGVWREADAGHTITFDPLFAKGTSLPGPGDRPLRVSRRYHPVHNIGHFRYLECSHRADDGRPLGDITLWDEILFPFDPALEERRDFGSSEVRRSDCAPSQEIEEAYSCDAGGTVTVAISNLTGQYHREYRLGRWAAAGEPVVPGKGKARSKKAAARKA
jgi:molecular chaperone DnaK (HSP70)